MKTYIIFTPEITNMGGAQMYTANKVQFLKKKGWNVQVFFPKRKGDVLIPELKEFENNLILELGIELRFMTRSMKKSAFQRIECFCKDSDEIVVESQIINHSFLVEEIAAYLGARHIINTLDERIPICFKKQNVFFEYKLRRWEFQNAGERRLKQVFGNDYKQEFLAFKNNMVYNCSNVVSEDSQELTFSDSDSTILSIGRLDKPYIIPMTEEIKLFATKHADKSMNVIYVGGSFTGEEEGKIKSILESVNNVNLYMLGYTFPVPFNVISIADVAIACANSVNVTADKDVPTIVADINDSMAIGVYGYDTENKFARVLEPKIAISKLLEAVLIGKHYPRKGILTDSMSDENEAFERELAFIERSKNNTGYYDVKSLMSLKTRIISRLVWWKYKILDPKRLDPRRQVI